MVHKRAAHPSKRRTFSTETLVQRQQVMFQQPQHQRLYAKANVQLAIFDLQREQIESVQLAEKVYKVPQTTIQ
jgi:hypothetical protein